MGIDLAGFDQAGFESVEINQAVERARSAIAAVYRHPASRNAANHKGWPRTAAAASVRAARASAALDGARLALDTDRDVIGDPVLAGALRVSAAIGSLVTVWPRSPLQALARLHTLAAADLVPTADLGRPRSSSAVSVGIARFADLVVTAPWPAPVQVALVHGELLALRPFDSGNGVVARAAARLTMVSTGLDPAGLGVPEVAHLRSRSRYRDLAAGLASGDPAQARDWVLEVCRCLTDGAREGLSIAEASASNAGTSAT